MNPWLMAALLLAGAALVGLHFHDMRERKRSRLVRDVMPGERIITKRETTAGGSTSEGVVGFKEVKMAEVKIDRGEWYVDDDGEFRFRVVAANNEILAWGESYVDKDDCLAALEALCHGAPIIKGKAYRATLTAPIADGG